MRKVVFGLLLAVVGSIHQQPLTAKEIDPAATFTAGLPSSPCQQKEIAEDWKIKSSSTRAIVNGEYGTIDHKVKGHIWDINGSWVHHNYKDKEAATAEYEESIKQILGIKAKGGLSAAVYTQWTDVENEMNGIYTYDRKVIKLHKDRVTAANHSTYQGDIAK